MERITPGNLRELRKKLGLSSQQAADSVYKNRRLWQRYEAPVAASSSLNIPPATLELFCLKHGLSYPPNPKGKVSKLVSFWGGQGGAGHTLLTIDICTLLMQEGFDVLIVTGKYGASIYQNKATELNLPFPRVYEVEEYILSSGHGVIDAITAMNDGCKEIKAILPNYDFVFLDIAKDASPRFFEELQPDLIIGPANLDDVPIRQMQAYQSVSDLRRRFDEIGNTFTKLALLMVNVPTDYTFKLEHSWLLDFDCEKQPKLASWLEKERIKTLKHFKNEQEDEKQAQIELLKLFYLLPKVNISIMNSYTSDTYKAYTYNFENGFSIFSKAPYSLPAHELRGVKNEILRLLGVPEKRI